MFLNTKIKKKRPRQKQRSRLKQQFRKDVTQKKESKNTGGKRGGESFEEAEMERGSVAG